MALTQIAQSSLATLSVSSLTFALNCTGADLLIVGGGERVAASSVTYNGVSLTAYTSVTNGAANARQFSLNSPASGSNNVVVTMTTTGHSAAVASCYSGFNSGSIVLGSTGTGSSTSIATGTITNASGDLVVDYYSHGGGGTTPGASQTVIANPTAGANSNGASYKSGTGSGFTMSWSGGGSSVWAISALVITPGAGGGATYIPKIMMS